MPGVHIPRSRYQGPVVDHYMGRQPQLWDDQQPVEQFFEALAERSWVRIDYMHWTLQRPGSMPIGAPVLNQSSPLNVFDNINGIPAGIGIIPQTGNIALDDTSGIRGTWGIDLQNADLELEFFGTEQNHDGFNLSGLANGRMPAMVGDPLTSGTIAHPNVVIPLLSNGAPGDASTPGGVNYLIQDSSFQTTLTSQVWGAEATLLSEPYLPGPGFKWQWLGGFRYLAYEEEFRNRGVSGPPASAATTVTTFGGSTVNNIYGPEVGGRMSVVNKWFTLSATPRIAFALNDYTGITSSAPLGAAETRFSGSDVEFTPIVQLSFTGEIHLTSNFSIFGGYDFMWIYRMTRPFDNIVYNSTPALAGGFTPNITQAIDLESFYARGLSVGCVFRY